MGPVNRVKQLVGQVMDGRGINTVQKSQAALQGQKTNYKISYAQSGEDLIVQFIFDFIGVTNPTYIDIGAHDPELLSNTHLFYTRGCRGINIEPNPGLYAMFPDRRKDDINLNIGISDKSGVMDFYVMSSPTLSTFVKGDAERLVSEEMLQITEVKKIPVETISGVIEKYCNGRFPDFLSIDVEGLELEILKSIDYGRAEPTVICAETLVYSTKQAGLKETEIIEFLKSKGYMVYADTYINTIFVKNERWVNAYPNKNK